MALSYAKRMKLKGELRLMKEISPGLKPNFSALARESGISRQTIARMWNEPDKSDRSRQKKKSQFDPYYPEIYQKFEQNAATIKAVFKYFQNKYGTDGPFRSYDSFKSYVKANELTKARGEYMKSHVRYETGPGEEIQVDWIESLKITLTTGEVIEFNIFTAVFGYSRYVKMIFSPTRTTEDFIRCVIETLEDAGGKPEKIKTDNMSAIVKVVNGKKNKLAVIKQFEKDIDVPIELCKVRNPQSKGKCESANRYASWLKPYDHTLDSEAGLIKAIETISRQINQEPSRTTGQPRCLLMKKEKEHLRPLNRKLLLDSYLEDVDTQTVPSTLLVTYKGHGYSVPKKYIGKRIKLVQADQSLQIYYNSELVCTHDLSGQPINYKPDHYIEGLKESIKKREEETEEDYEDKIRKKAEASLKRMKDLKGKSK